MADSPSSLTQYVDRTWPVHQWRDVNVAVALSGGADSVGLLRTVRELKRHAGGAGRLVALHVNHGLRGAESDEDAAWCQQLCESLAVPLEVLAGDAAERAAREGDGIEAAARSERYELLAAAARREGARYLATAHTRDDQVETVLMRMLRGAGLRGLAGIPRVRPLSQSLALVRPLLDASRADVEAYLAQVGQTFRTDSSNAGRTFARNRVRHQLLPLLRSEYNAQVDDVLWRLAEQARDAQHVLETLAAEVLEDCHRRRDERAIELCVESLHGQPRAIVCEALRMVWREAKLAEQAMTYDWWQRLAALALGESKLVLNLPGDVRASMADDRLRLSWQ